jgi:hypothetical protein
MAGKPAIAFHQEKAIFLTNPFNFFFTAVS